jgi:hypothetical protein
MGKKTKTRAGQWIDDVVGAIGRHVHLETTDGVLREGRFTGLGMREIQVNGQTREVPNRVELNGDPSDYVDFGLIARITID